MSGSNIYNIPLRDDDSPAPKDHRAVSPRVGVVTRQQAKSLSPHQYSSTPTLSSSSSTSGNFSRSTDSDPTASPSSRNLRSRRPKGSSSTVNDDSRTYMSPDSRTYMSPDSRRYVSPDSRSYVSPASNPQRADEDSDTQSEQTPLMEGSVGSVDVQMSDGDDDDQSVRVEGFDVLVKVLSAIAIGGLCVAGILILHSFWYKDVPKIPEGFVSNITEVIDTDANMDMN